MGGDREPTLQYEPLDYATYEFRLLKILPDLRANGSINCILEHSVLVKAPKYVALSYCWGDPSKTKDISINRIMVPVTTNLECALRHIRNPSTGSGWLWIDALCINQKDLQEKGLQLQRMGHIYAKADEVLVWLGPESQSTKAAFQTLTAWSRIIPGSKKPKISGISALVNQTYWRRVWIIQEIAKGTRVKIRWGKDHISWEDLANGIQNIYRVQGSHRENITLAMDLIIALKKFSDQEKSGQKARLLDAMLASRLSLSTEPRDKVLALLGLSGDGEYMLPTPNYVQSDLEIRLEISLSIMRRYPEKLHVIFLGKNQSKSGDLELSWLPNWFQLPDKIPPWTTASPVWENPTKDDPEATSQLYPPIKTTSLMTTTECSYLLLTGKRIGMIHRQGGSTKLPLRPRYANHIFQRMLEAIDLPFNTISTTGDDHPHMGYMKRTILAKLLLGSFSKPDKLTLDPKVLNWLSSHRDWAYCGHSLAKWASIVEESIISKNPIMGWALEPFVSTATFGHDEMGIIERWNRRFALLLNNRMDFFFTYPGSVAGIGPCDVQSADLVFQLSGCCAIVRKYQDGYKLVGQAFVNVANYGRQDIPWQEVFNKTSPNAPGYLPAPLLAQSGIGLEGLLRENYEPNLTLLKEEEIKLY